jgi:hypothetical protein
VDKNSTPFVDYLFFMWQEKSFDEYKSVGSAWHKDSIVASIYQNGLYKNAMICLLMLEIIMIINSTICFFVALELQMDLQSRYTWIPNGESQSGLLLAMVFRLKKVNFYRKMYDSDRNAKSRQAAVSWKR